MLRIRSKFNPAASVDCLPQVLGLWTHPVVEGSIPQGLGSQVSNDSSPVAGR